MKNIVALWERNRIGMSTQIIGALFFIFYSFLSIYFYQERMLSFESAAMAFELISTKSFVVTLDRWGCIFSQILPLIAIKSGCSLGFFLKTYSLGFVLLNYLGFLIVTILFKNNRMGIVYLLTLCLVHRNTFYFTGAIYSQGLPLIIILYTMILYFLNDTSKYKRVVLIASFFLIALLYFFHQLLVIPIVFALSVAIVNTNDFKNKQLMSLLIFTILWFGIRIILLPGDSYEHARIPGLAVFKNEIPHFFNLPSFKYFANFFMTEMIVAFGITTACGLILLYKKKYMLFSLFMGFSLAYLVLIIITYYKGQSPFMYERYYILFGLFIALQLDVVWAKKMSTKYLALLIIPLLVYSSQRVYAAHYQPTIRVGYINALAKKGKTLKNRKYIIHQDDVPWEYVWAIWGMPVELLLASSIEDPKNSVTIYVHSKHDTVDYSANNGKLLSIDWMASMLDSKKFDSNYFNIPSNTDYLVTNRLFLKRDEGKE